MNANPILLASPKIRQVQKNLAQWYQHASRDLAWRRTRDPYAIWVSEIMLQQTQVAMVLPYYQRFLKTFPNLPALARAPQDRVLRLWEGLGYYSRARHLHAAAQWLIRHNRGKIPQSAEQMQKLPGIGLSTANAIASIAFGEKVPVLDGNVKRVLIRLFMIRKLPNLPATVKQLWSLAQNLVPDQNPGDHNQAIMELGALVCMPRHPQCPECPLKKMCRAYIAGVTEQLPLRGRKKPLPHFDVAVAVILRAGRVLLGKRPAKGMLAGLWEFPGGKVRPGETPTQALTRKIHAELGVAIRPRQAFTRLRHAYTHFTISLTAFRCTLFPHQQPAPCFHQAIRWVGLGLLDKYPMAITSRRVAEQLLKKT